MTAVLAQGSLVTWLPTAPQQLDLVVVCERCGCQPSRNPPRDPQPVNPPREPRPVNPPRDPQPVNPPRDPQPVNPPRDPQPVNLPRDP
eukprot:148058-Chlamydomonas_euryale.AAC.2